MMSLLSRILIAIAVALMLSGTISHYVGAKTENTYEESITISEEAIGILAVTSTTVVSSLKITAKNIDGVFYAVAKLDPREFTQLTSIRDARVIIDLRSSIIYITGSINKKEEILLLISMLNPMGEIDVKDGEATIEHLLEPRETLILIMDPASNTIQMNIHHRSLDYDKLSLTQTLILSATLIMLSLAMRLHVKRNFTRD